MNRRVADVVSVVVLLLLTLALYRKVTRLWWTYDDAYLLHIAIEHPAQDHFVGSSIWRSMPQRLFTPILTATYDAELSAFGLSARNFYVLHVALIALLAVMIFTTARLWFPATTAACTAILAIAGAPMANAATELMLVHYLESLILAVASIAVFTVACRRNSTQLSILSAILYLAAMLAKEIAVPIVVVLFLLDRKRTAPHWITLLVYAIWRRIALGVWIGGYGWTIRTSDLPSLITSFPAAVFHRLSGPAIAAGVALIVLLAAGIALRMRSRSDALRVFVIVVLCIAPALPMAKVFESRFALTLWIACSAAACAGFQTITHRQVRAGLLLLTIALALIVNRQQWAREIAVSQRMSDEARAFFELGSGDAMRKPAVPAAAMNEFQWLKETHEHGTGGTQWFYDDIFLCENPMPRRMFSYDPRRRMVVESNDAASIARTYCGSIKTNAPLSASFHHEDESLFWSLGPYERGEYAVVMQNGVRTFDVPRNDGFRLPGVAALQFRVRYAAPEGWVTYSPELSLDFTKQQDFEWHR